MTGEILNGAPGSFLAAHMLLKMQA